MAYKTVEFCLEDFDSSEIIEYLKEMKLCQSDIDSLIDIVEYNDVKTFKATKLNSTVL